MAADLAEVASHDDSQYPEAAVQETNTSAQTEDSESQASRFDVNQDGAVNENDVDAVFQFLAREAGTSAISAEDSPLDVNRDGRISPRDALAIINQMTNALPVLEGESVPHDVNRDGAVTREDVMAISDYLTRRASPDDEMSDPLVASLDVNEDGVVSPLDMLSVINQIDRTGPQLESEDSVATAFSEAETEQDVLHNPLNQPLELSIGTPDSE